MVLDVHGGPWAHDSWGFNPEHQLLADRGYAAYWRNVYAVVPTPASVGLLGLGGLLAARRRR